MAALTSSNQVVTVSGTTEQFGTAMNASGRYCMISTTDCWVRIGATGAAAAVAGTDSFFLPANMLIEVAAETTTLGFVNVIQASAGGSCCLVLAER